MLDLAYGIKVDSPESPVSERPIPHSSHAEFNPAQYVVSSRQVVKIFVAASQPGRFLVDTFPICAYSVTGTLDVQCPYGPD